MLKFKSALNLKSLGRKKKDRVEEGGDGERSSSSSSSVAVAAEADVVVDDSDRRPHDSLVSLLPVLSPSPSSSSMTRLVRSPPTSPEDASGSSTSAKRRRRGSAKEPTQTRLVLPQKPPPTAVSKFGRHVVTEVRRHLMETHLILKCGGDVDDEGVRTCILRGSWAVTQVGVGDVVNVLTDFDQETGAFKVDDFGGLLVVNPDLLVSSTSIVSTLFCMRKAVLNEMFKGLEGSSKTMFIGTLVHELLQECLRNKASTAVAVQSHLENILAKKTILQELLILNITLKEVKQEVEQFLPHILFFSERYVLGKEVMVPSPAFATAPETGRNSQQQQQQPSLWPGKVEAVEDIEENIWSPRLGIKGKVDLTVGVSLRHADRKGRLSKTMPLELKTGRASGSAEHKGQVILYSMMMSERREDPEAGLLLYLRNSSLQEVQAGLHEMRGLIQLRNELASNLKGKRPDGEPGLARLPEPINLRRACGQCPHLLACCLHQRLDKEAPPPAPSHAMADLVPQTLAHLPESHASFFESWSLMCSLEAEESRKSSKLRQLWCEAPAQREKMSLCVANLSLDVEAGSAEGGKKHTFNRTEGEGTLPRLFIPGETVIVSTDSELALSQGVVLSIEEELRRITVILDRDLHSCDCRSNVGGSCCKKKQKVKRYHLDRYEYQGSMSSNLVNLVRLMSPTGTAEKLRRLVIDRETVTFLTGLPRQVVDVGKHILRPLNRVQQKAVFKTMMAEQYVLLKGMPGTGKTTLIVALVRLLAAMGKSILLASYTHSAVDNILLKLMQADKGTTKFLRLGRRSRIHEHLLPHSADALSEEKTDLEQLKDLYSGCPVIATTCLGLNHPAVLGRRFDYCILDEAGQALLLSALGPLFHAEKFVLVGDPQQLPPVVQSKEARTLGMDESLFSRLAAEANTIPLTIQYRMNSTIMSCANRLVYDGLLECSSDQVASKTIGIKILPPTAPGWMERVASDKLEDAIVFLDTNGLCGEQEILNAFGVTNPTEAGIVKQIVDSLVDAGGVDETSIGVISPYRAQVALLKQTLGESRRANVDVNTVDQFQGKDKDVIIYSCAKSRKGSDSAKVKKVGDILSDMRRLNVAITRAKAKLIMIGNKETLENYDIFSKLFNCFDPAAVCALKNY